METLKMRERKMRDCKNAGPDKERVTEAACEIAEMWDRMECGPLCARKSITVEEIYPTKLWHYWRHSVHGRWRRTSSCRRWLLRVRGVLRGARDARIASWCHADINTSARHLPKGWGCPLCRSTIGMLLRLYWITVCCFSAFTEFL